MRKNAIIILLIFGILFVLVGISLSYKQDQSITPKVSISPTAKQGQSSEKILANKNIQEYVIINKVLDGDTVETDRGEKIRYLGINAPEKGQPFSSDSTALNKSLVLGKKVRLERDVQTKDRYGRNLAYIFVGDTFVNLEMVKRGLAVSETIQPNIKYQDEIVRVQEEARNNCLGIWKGLCQKETSASCIKIASIHADAVGDDNKNKNGEWIEIKNECNSAVNMNMWLLKDSSASNKYEFKNFSLDSGKNVTIYSGCGKDLPDKLYWQCPELKYAIWNNQGDEAFLYNDKGEMVSDFKY